VFVIALGCPSSARAQTASETPRVFPEAEVDRPLVLFAGMTAFDFSFILPTLRIAMTDAMGNATIGVSRLGQYVGFDAAFQHSLGTVELFGGYSGYQYGSTLTAGVRIDLGRFGSMDVLAFDEIPRDTNVDYSYGQQVTYFYKRIIAPHRLALVGRVGASIQELRITPLMQPTVSGAYVSSFVGVDAEVQLTSRLAVDIGSSVDVPAYASSGLTSESTTLNPYVELLFALRRWDFYAYLSASDITRTPFPFASFGVRRRWGG
jgi:hypothetical protein